MIDEDFEAELMKEYEEYMATREDFLEEGYRHHLLAEAADMIDEMGIEEFLDKVHDYLNSLVEAQKVHEIKRFCKDHAFGEEINP